MKTITVNGKDYPSIKAACIELDLSWHLLSKHFRNTNSTSVELDDNNNFLPAYINTKRRGDPLPQSWLDSIEPGKQLKLHEVSAKLFELGITKTLTTKSNIQQIEKKAIAKLKEILEEDKDVLIYFNML